MPINLKKRIYVLAAITATVLPIGSLAFAEARIGINVPEGVSVNIDKGGALSEAEIKGCKLVTAQVMTFEIETKASALDDANSFMSQKNTEIKNFAQNELKLDSFELSSYKLELISNNQTSAFQKSNEDQDYRALAYFSYDYSPYAASSELENELAKKGYKAKLSTREFQQCQ